MKPSRRSSRNYKSNRTSPSWWNLPNTYFSSFSSSSHSWRKRSWWWWWSMAVCWFVLWQEEDGGTRTCAVLGVKLDDPLPPPPPPPPSLPLTLQPKQRSQQKSSPANGSLFLGNHSSLSSSSAAASSSSSSSTRGEVQPTVSSSQHTTTTTTARTTTAATTTTTTSSNDQLHHQVVQLTETEIWDGTKWRAPGVLLSSLQKGANDGRWTKKPQPDQEDSITAIDNNNNYNNINNKNKKHAKKSRSHVKNKEKEEKDDESCLPPSQQKVPKGCQWEGEWKILTNTSTRDTYGWEYSHVRPYPMRQRIWLRKFVPLVRTPSIIDNDQKGDNKPNKNKEQSNKNDSSSSSTIMTASNGGKKTKKSTKSKSGLESLSTTTTTSSSNDLKAKTKKTTTTKKKQQQQQQSKKKTTMTHHHYLPRRWVRSVADDFNFKGLSISFWKGIVFPKSFSIVFRLPLTSHFNWWDGHRALPKANASMMLHCFPPMIGISLSASLRLVWIKWCLYQIYLTIQFTFIYLIWTICRIFVYLLSILTFPITGRLLWWNPPPYFCPLPRRPWGEIVDDNGGSSSSSSYRGPVYPRDYEESVGCSYSWRISTTRGYHTAARAWHSYSPSIASLWKGLDQALSSSSSSSSSSYASSFFKSLLFWPKTMPRWIARRSANLAFSISGPALTEPYFSGSTGLSLSGFYLRTKKQQSPQSQPPRQRQEQQEQPEPEQQQRVLSSKKGISLTRDVDDDDDDEEEDRDLANGSSSSSPSSSSRDEMDENEVDVKNQLVDLNTSKIDNGKQTFKRKTSVATTGQRRTEAATTTTTTAAVSVPT